MIIEKQTVALEPPRHPFDNQSAGSSSRRGSYVSLRLDDKPLPPQPPSESNWSPGQQSHFSPSTGEAPPGYYTVNAPRRGSQTLVDAPRRGSQTLVVPYQNQMATLSRISNASSRPRTPNASNALSFKTSNEPITGTFQIDPAINVSQDEPSGRKKKKSKWPWENGDAAAAEDWTPNAVFQTRQGDITLNLSVIGGEEMSPVLMTPTVQRAVVDVSTKQGDVSINVFHIDAGRYLNLKIETRKGNIHVWLPRTFRGPVHLRTKKGRVAFLPNLQTAAKVLRASETDAMVVLGSDSTTMASFESAAGGPGLTGDFMTLTTHGGEIVLGYYEEDVVPEKPTMWQKMTEWMGSSKKGRTDSMSSAS